MLFESHDLPDWNAILFLNQITHLTGSIFKCLVYNLYDFVDTDSNTFYELNSHYKQT